MRTRTRRFRGRLANRVRGKGDRGSSILEFTGFLPILIVIGLACIQLGLIGYGINQAGTGARAAARATSLGGDGQAAGTASVSDWLNPQVEAPLGAGDTTTATVTVTVPAIIPIFDSWPVTRRATMPNDKDD
ncbi:TadE/TadG family type IV pilus assembly protein [Streptomyces sp. WI04-05B]|uniref:TadE/TadG family type IV pilus assembly protein n=1 Tax=Streptomyces TaxID=1883 RepID=UPI00299FFADA|nr:MULTISPECIES: TadE/TadG family type IV pilus assembly protein [unclassified Streptomyces]MDX2542300.1 TadE/TadG family type IV pilus assembly protein [Streptomyces sp. WI04-05B]MDX2584132.1 TadE/TadG family type IV pilus assembly protein [Streptomyces sp. WI04-05A]MDX3751167.1 TadE/TadG family type IV pilus assembly protein [Streptomyces sp. AK08-02]